MADQIKLTDQQALAVEILTGDEHGVVKGYAGTGKTTVIGEALKAASGSTLLLAPTNKAALVMAKATDHPAATIHSATMTAVQVTDKRTGEKRLQFVEKPLAEVQHVRRIIIDEASMLSNRDWAKALNTLERTFRGTELPPIIMVGDGFQLPPVESNSDEPGAFVDWQRAYRTVELTEVHRQAEGSDVLAFATKLRTMRDVDYPTINLKDHFAKLSTEIEPEDWAKVLASGSGVDLVATNVHRISLLKEVRRHIAGAGMLPPMAGERMIAYASWRRKGGPETINSMTYTVTKDAVVTAFGGWVFEAMMDHTGEVAVHTVRPELVFEPTQQMLWNSDYTDMATYEMIGAPLTFGYAMTVHKSQGSQYPFVAIPYSKITFEHHARALYTAVTRAQKGVYLL